MKTKLQNIFTSSISYLIYISIFLVAIAGFGRSFVINGHNVYKDFLVGVPAYLNGNKTGEWKLFWLLIFVGIFLTAIFAFIKKEQSECDNDIFNTKYAFLSFLPLIIQVLIYGKIQVGLLILFVSLFVTILLYKEKCIDKINHFIVFYFAFESCAVILGIIFQNYYLGDHKVLGLALFSFAVYEWLLYKNVFDKKGALIFNFAQLLVPFLSFIYLKDKYQTTEGVVTLTNPGTYVCIVICIIVLLEISGFYQLFKNTNEKKNSSTVLFSTVFSIFAFVSYISPAQILPFDLHHHGEQALPYQQIVTLGQKAYEEYAPASGFFPMIPGFFQNVLFKGYANAYGMSFVLFALLFEFITIYLLYRKIGGKYSLLIALIYHMPVYCRGYMILPTLLILSDKKLIEKKFSWLMMYVFLSFLGGLYYPLFGAALLIGSMPFACVQLALLLKNNDYSKVQLVFATCLTVLVIIFIPILYRLLKHIMAMGSQTICVDGECIFGTDAPEWFVPFLKGTMYYQTVYEVARIVLPVVFVCVLFYLLFRYLKNNEKNISVFGTDIFYSLSAMPIALCVCYTYTMVCMDESWVANLLSRSAHVLISICFVFLYSFLINNGKKLFSYKYNFLLIMIALSVPFMFLYQNHDNQFPHMEGATDADDELLFSYQNKMIPFDVREGNILITEETMSCIQDKYPFVNYDRFGNGFVREDVLDRVNRLQLTLNYLREFDPDLKILAFQQSQMYYYLLDEKAVYNGRSAISRSKEATDLVLSQMDLKHTVIGSGLIPLEEYYLYHNIVEAGYAYSTDFDMYLPKEFYEKIYGAKGNYSLSSWTMQRDIESVANAFGQSRDSLTFIEPVDISNVNVNIENPVIEITFDNINSGLDADFIYLETNSTKGKLYISYDDREDVLSMDVGTGDLFIPIGINPEWLVNSHYNIKFRLETNENVDFCINEISFYKLKK